MKRSDEEAFDDEPMFTGKIENGYAIQVCRDSIRQSGNEELLPKKKSMVIEKILEEPESFLCVKRIQSKPNNLTLVIQKHHQIRLCSSW